MPMINQYCPVCQVHTDHVDLYMMYATACTVCGTHTSSLERNAVAAINHQVAPDGTVALVVHNTPTTVTFYVDQGPHRGYYDYDKNTGKRTIRQATPK